jgi:RNA polymerase sigma-70 factor, ECF subfamily
MNTISLGTVFMNEAKWVVVENAILSGLASADRSKTERDPVEHCDEMLEALVRDHSRLVYRIAYAVLRRHDDAEDAAQETFLRVLRYRSKLGAVKDPKAWLARIAWRVAVDRRKQHGRNREIPVQDPPKPFAEVASRETSADQRLCGDQVGAVLKQLITALPPKLRQPLILSTVEEMSLKDVAATLAINEEAVRSRVFRARQLLKQKLAQRLSWKQR